MGPRPSAERCWRSFDTQSAAGSFIKEVCIACGDVAQFDNADKLIASELRSCSSELAGRVFTHYLNIGNDLMEHSSLQNPQVTEMYTNQVSEPSARVFPEIFDDREARAKVKTMTDLCCSCICMMPHDSAACRMLRAARVHHMLRAA